VDSTRPYTSSPTAGTWTIPRVAGTENGCPVTCDQVLTVTLTAGTTYYIIGDGYSNFGNVTGAYQIDIIKNP
jgi:hypothetical protein